MRSANIADVWPDDTGEDEKNISNPPPQVSTPVITSARIQGIEPASPSPQMSDIDMIVMERLSTVIILMLGCVTGLLIQIDRLRREVRLLRVGVPRPL